LKECFYNSDSRIPKDRKATIEKCQDPTSIVFDSKKLNPAKNAGQVENDLTPHKDQDGMKVWGHYETQ
jgi:hypothetical protein